MLTSFSTLENGLWVIFHNTGKYDVNEKNYLKCVVHFLQQSYHLTNESFLFVFFSQYHSHFSHTQMPLNVSQNISQFIHHL